MAATSSSALSLALAKVTVLQQDNLELQKCLDELRKLDDAEIER